MTCLCPDGSPARAKNRPAPLDVAPYAYRVLHFALRTPRSSATAAPCSTATRLRTGPFIEGRWPLVREMPACGPAPRRRAGKGQTRSPRSCDQSFASPWMRQRAALRRPLPHSGPAASGIAGSIRGDLVATGARSLARDTATGPMSRRVETIRRAHEALNSGDVEGLVAIRTGTRQRPRTRPARRDALDGTRRPGGVLRFFRDRAAARRAAGR
jgi:hypothetical protein